MNGLWPYALEIGVNIAFPGIMPADRQLMRLPAVC